MFQRLNVWAVVSGASWNPYYDFHATTRDGRLSSEVIANYCANITQSTGEDWDGATLTLSTANSQTLQKLSVPTVETIKILATSSDASARIPLRQRSPPSPRMHFSPGPRIGVSIPRSPSRSRSLSPPSPMYRGPPSVYYVDQPAPSLPPPAKEVHVRVEGSNPQPLGVVLHLSDAVSLPSDGLAHRVSVAALNFNAELKHVCVPRQMEAAFIEATIQNTSEYELLAGPVSVFMDNRFVTKTSLGVSPSRSCSSFSPCLLVIWSSLSASTRNSAAHLAWTALSKSHSSRTHVLNRSLSEIPRYRSTRQRAR